MMTYYAIMLINDVWFLDASYLTYFEQSIQFLLVGYLAALSALCLSQIMLFGANRPTSCNVR